MASLANSLNNSLTNHAIAASFSCRQPDRPIPVSSFADVPRRLGSLVAFRAAELVQRCGVAADV
jgi:hypothetical protein